jgi:hypothetical protein
MPLNLLSQGANVHQKRLIESGQHVLDTKGKETIMMNGYGMMGLTNMPGPFMWIFMLLLWGFAVFGLVCAVKGVFITMRRNNGKR